MENKTKTQIEEHNEGFKTAFYFLKFAFNISISLMWALVYGFIILGSACSMVLLIKIYPNLFITLWNPVYPIFMIILLIIKIFLEFVIFLGLVTLIVWIFMKSSDKRRLKREKQREQFLEDLAIKLKDKMKKK